MTSDLAPDLAPRNRIMTRFHAHDLAPDLAPTSPRIKARSYDLTSPPERVSVRHTLPRRGEVEDPPKLPGARS